jgi:uncharacterized damage-inducible protein DinB
MNPGDLLRKQMSKFLDWEDSHVGFDKAVAGIPRELRGKRPAGTAHSLWELVEHIRLAQRDILDFCRSDAYVEPRWPADYWPPSPEPSSPDAWDESIDGVREDRAVLQALAADPSVDLFALVPHGAGAQTYLRELLVVVDHGAYHIGQLVTTRQLLGVWPVA